MKKQNNSDEQPSLSRDEVLQQLQGLQNAAEHEKRQWELDRSRYNRAHGEPDEELRDQLEMLEDFELIDHIGDQSRTDPPTFIIRDREISFSEMSDNDRACLGFADVIVLSSEDTNADPEILKGRQMLIELCLNREGAETPIEWATVETPIDLWGAAVSMILDVEDLTA